VKNKKVLDKWRGAEDKEDRIEKLKKEMETLETDQYLSRICFQDVLNYSKKAQTVAADSSRTGRHQTP